MKNNFSDEYVFSERGLNSLGYKLLGKDKIDQAIAVFQLNVNEHPESFNVYDSIGEALMKVAELEAERRDCETLRLCSGLQRESAHRFYERFDMEKKAYSFVKKLI